MPKRKFEEISTDDASLYSEESVSQSADDDSNHSSASSKFRIEQLSLLNLLSFVMYIMQNW